MKFIVLTFLCIASVWSTPLQQKQPIKKFSGGRIVGGQEAVDKQFPWQVAVYFDNNEGSFFCGGALISPSWVLTAGHCVYGARIFTLHFGSNSLVDVDSNRVEMTVTNSVAHPNYTPTSLNDDIGLIQLNTPVELNEYIQTIPLDTVPLEGNVPVVVSGWGATGDWDGAVNHLNYVNLTTITNTQCQAIYGQAAITAGMVCAVGRTIEGTCTGDSGGPLIALNAAGAIVHVGLVSWASASGCETDHPSGYTRTASYLDWIRSVTGV